MRRVTAVLVASLAAGLLPGCPGRQGPRPGTGAATPEELVAAYRRAHEAGDPEQFRQFDLTLALLPEWGPVSGDYAADLRKLFKLRLGEVRFAEMPAAAAREGLHYLSRKPNGEPSVDNLLGDVRGKLVLTGRRPDGREVTVDPGLGVVGGHGKLYVEALRRVLADAATAVDAGRPPVCRPFPLGTTGMFIAQELDYKDWGRANRQLDDLERQLNAAGQGGK
jgi:hypothetical protein